MLFSNEKYTAEIDGLGAFVSLLSGGKQFVNARLPLFAFRLREKDEVSYTTSDEAQKVEITKNDRAVSLRYDFLGISFIVNVSFDSRISAYFSFVNKTDKYVEWVDFLQIAVCSDLVKQGGSGKIVMDINEGVLYDDINLKEKDGISKYKDIEYPSLGLHALFPAVVESQFISYYDDTAGIYIATEDNERNLKGIDCRPFENAIKLQFRLFIGEDKNTENFTLPYNQVIDFFKGDWHCAAELYRNWFYDNLPEGLVAVKDNENLPEWYADSPLIVAYPLQGVHDMDPSGPNKLFPYNNACPLLTKLQVAPTAKLWRFLCTGKVLLPGLRLTFGLLWAAKNFLPIFPMKFTKEIIFWVFTAVVSVILCTVILTILIWKANITKRDFQDICALLPQAKLFPTPVSSREKAMICA